MILQIALALAAVQAGKGGYAVESTQFYHIDDRTDPPVIEETTVIPYRPGQSCFGWAIWVSGGSGDVTVQEEYRLAGPAPNWSADSNSTIHDDRAGATTQLRENLDDGLLSNEWCITEGDPIGPYAIRVYDGDALLGAFDFEVAEISESMNAE
jgi:hypothetical protein